MGFLETTSNQWRRLLPFVLIALGGLEWAAVMINALIKGHGGLEGSAGLVAIAAGLFAIGRLPSGGRGVSAKTLSVIGAFILVGIAAAGLPEVQGIVLFLLIPTAFAFGPLILALWALRRAAGASMKERAIAASMLLAVMFSMGLSAVEPSGSIILSAAFGFLTIAFGAIVQPARVRRVG
jgi:hypothetical protein